MIARLLRHWELPGLGLVGILLAWRAWTGGSGWLTLSSSLVIAGLLMNALVMALNGGRMPVALDADEQVVDSAAGLYTPIDARTRLRFLADWITIGSRVFSPGDFLLYSGVAVGVVRIVLER